MVQYTDSCGVVIRPRRYTQMLGTHMEEQSILKQTFIGAVIGLALFFVSQLVAPDAHPEPLFTPRGLGQMVGGAFGGVVLYMLYYRIRQRKK